MSGPPNNQPPNRPPRPAPRTPASPTTPPGGTTPPATPPTPPTRPASPPPASQTPPTTPASPPTRQRSGSSQTPTPPPRRRVVAQRAVHGSAPRSTTATVNTPKICKVHNIHLKQVWSSDTPPAPPPAVPAEPIDDVERNIEALRKEVEDKQKEFDQKVLNPPIPFDFDAEQSRLNAFIQEKEVAILEWEIKRGKIIADKTTVDYKPPSGIREFLIVKEITPDIQQSKIAAEQALTSARAELLAASQQWLALHKTHEDTKVELAGFIKKKRSLNEARNKACKAYESARQKKRRKQAKLKKSLDKAKLADQKAAQDLASERSKSHGSSKPAQWLAKKQIEAAEKKKRKSAEAVTQAQRDHDALNAESADEREMKAKFQTAKREYERFTSTEYERLVNREKAEYKSLIAKAEEVLTKTQALEKVESDRQQAINTLATGSEIQMIGFASNDSYKSSNVTVVANQTGKLKFEDAHKAFFNTAAHINSAFPTSRIHPVIELTENQNPKQTFELTTSLTPFESHRMLVSVKEDPAESGLKYGFRKKIGDGLNSLGNIKEFFRNLQNTPKTRDYKIDAKSCDVGTKPGGLPDEVFSRLAKELGVTIKTYPADTYTVSITAKPFKSIGAQVGEKRNLETGVDSRDDKTTNEEWGIDQNPEEPDAPLVYAQTDLSTITDPAARSLAQAQNEANRAAAEAAANEEKILDSLRVPNQKPVLQQVPIDISLKRNDYEDPITEDLRETVGLILFLAQKSADLFSRIGNIVPSMGWKVGFEASFMTGKLSYIDEWKEHTDWRVWHHRKAELDINIVTAKGFIFAGFAIDVLLVMIEFGAELYIKGSVGVKGSFENTHPDAAKPVKLGVGPTGSVGIGLEIRAIIGRPDWLKASGAVETALTAEAVWWLISEEGGTYVDYKFAWEGVSIIVVGHIALIGHWEKKWTPAKPRDIKSGRYPEKVDTESLMKELAVQREADMRKSRQSAKKLEKKRLRAEKKRQRELARRRRRP